MDICLERGGNDVHMVQLMPLQPIISCSSKIQNGLPFWYQLTKVVTEKRALNGCSVVVVLPAFVPQENHKEQVAKLGMRSLPFLSLNGQSKH